MNVAILIVIVLKMNVYVFPDTHVICANVILMLKIDIDNHKFKRWLGNFEYNYRKLLSKVSSKKQIARLKKGTVYRTRHGFHVYLETQSQHLSNHTINLLELFFGSDLKKQIYFYIEGNDILFKTKTYTNKKDNRKYSYTEKYEPFKTDKLNEKIFKLNREKHIFKKITLNTK